MEGYKNLNKKVKKLNWPKSPRSIFTSNSMHVDEVFKHYAGKNEKSTFQNISFINFVIIFSKL